MRPLFLMLALLLTVACGDTDPNETRALNRLVNDFLNHPDWSARREKRRNIINQGEAILPYLWSATDTDYFESLHHLLILLDDMRAFDADRWGDRRDDLRQEATTMIADASNEASLQSGLNRLSLYGELEDLEILSAPLNHPAREIRELALATAYRLGLPFKGSNPRTVADQIPWWLEHELDKTPARETLLWEHLEIAANDVYRQALVQGLAHCIVARPTRERDRASRLWQLLQAEEDAHVRVEMVLLLGILGDRRYQQPLLETRWLNSADQALQMATSWSLNQLGFRNPQPR